MHKATLLLCALLASGCTNNRYVNLVAGLNDRQVPSCVKADLALGGLFGAGAGAGTLHIVSATGPQTIEQCLKGGHDFILYRE